MSDEVGLGPGGATRRREHPAGDHVAVEEERPGAVADILELAALDPAGGYRLARVEAFQGLDAGHLVGADHPLASPGQGRGLTIQVAHRRGGGLEALVVPGRQPVPDQVRPEVPLPLRAAPRGGARSDRRYPA